MRRKLVFVEGGIAVGKSTILQRLEDMGHVVVKEDLETWRNCNGINMLHKAYTDGRAYGRLFQQLTISTHLRQLSEALSRARNAPVFVERSIYTNRIFADMQIANGTFPPEDAAVYGEFWNAAEAMFKLICPRDGFDIVHAYLRCNPEECAERIAARPQAQSDGESVVHVGYLEALQYEHDRLFGLTREPPRIRSQVVTFGTYNVPVEVTTQKVLDTAIGVYIS
jgi:deoxyadenosine/deoxycytidine kinase